MTDRERHYLRVIDRMIASEALAYSREVLSVIRRVILDEVTVPEPEAQFISLVLDGPPSHRPGRFVEVEDASGRSINAGEWRGPDKDGLWSLRIPVSSMSAIYDAGRAYVGGHYFLDVTDEEIRLLTDAETEQEIDRRYEGGWGQFVEDHR